MSKKKPTADERRDELARRILRTPPKPRKEKGDKEKPKAPPEKSGDRR